MNARATSDTYNRAVHIITVTLLFPVRSRSTGVSGNDDQWHQICTTWENVNGEWKLYKDGKMEKTGTDLMTGYVIQAGGSLVLGQEQDSAGGGFDQSQSFQGSLTNVNVWSHVLPDQGIVRMLPCR